MANREDQFQGFKRVDVRDLEILNSSTSTLLNIYLYTYKI